MWINIFILTLASMNKNNKFIFIFLFIHTHIFVSFTFYFLLFTFYFFIFLGSTQLSPCGLDSASPARSLAQASDLARLSNTRALTHACCYTVQVN